MNINSNEVYCYDLERTPFAINQLETFMSIIFYSRTLKAHLQYTVQCNDTRHIQLPYIHKAYHCKTGYLI